MFVVLLIFVYYIAKKKFCLRLIEFIKCSYCSEFGKEHENNDYRVIINVI